jgi:CRISPR/Cas system-associated endonuclease Cas3-HD
MKFRNYSLRLLLSDEYAGLKKIIEVQNIKIKYLKNITSKKLLKIYDKALSNYYDVNIMYNKLSEDEKTILETVLSLCY